MDNISNEVSGHDSHCKWGDEIVLKQSKQHVNEQEQTAREQNPNKIS